jgi:hypothetical protein
MDPLYRPLEEDDKEVWLAGLLKRFGDVRNLSLVLEYYGNIDGPLANLLISNTIDIDSTIQVYEQFEPPEWDEEPEVPSPIRLNTGWAEVNVDMI